MKHLTAAEINDACETVFNRSADMGDLRIFDFARLIEQRVAEREREACAEIADEYSRSAVLGNAEQATAEAIGKTIRMRPNGPLEGRDADRRSVHPRSGC